MIKAHLSARYRIAKRARRSDTSEDVVMIRENNVVMENNVVIDSRENVVMVTDEDSPGPSSRSIHPYL
jgi:RNA:NAD 2'-phosphotransferase (TPT1/KptA family)